MHTCSLLRTSFWSHSARPAAHAPSAARSATGTALAMVLGIAEFAGWHRLKDPSASGQPPGPSRGLAGIRLSRRREATEFGDRRKELQLGKGHLAVRCGLSSLVNTHFNMSLNKQ
jgi:hypothetical protein